MSDVTAPSAFSWSLASLKDRPARYLGVVCAVFIRYFMGLFFLSAGINKVRKGWLWSDYGREVFQARIADMEKLDLMTIEAFGLMYLKLFAVPFSAPISWILSLGELYVGIACLLGLTSRWAGAMAFFLMFNFAIGGYYDASLLPLMALALVLILTPSGHWLGLDRRMAAKHPGAVWFR